MDMQETKNRTESIHRQANHCDSQEGPWTQTPPLPPRQLGVSARYFDSFELQLPPGKMGKIPTLSGFGLVFVFAVLNLFYFNLNT